MNILDYAATTLKAAQANTPAAITLQVVDLNNNLKSNYLTAFNNWRENHTARRHSAWPTAARGRPGDVGRKQKRRLLNMKPLILLILAGGLAQAGIVKVVSYPVRHPVKSVRKTGHVIFFPAFHSKRTAHHFKRVIW